MLVGKPLTVYSMDGAHQKTTDWTLWRRRYLVTRSLLQLHQVARNTTVCVTSHTCIDRKAPAGTAVNHCSRAKYRAPFAWVLSAATAAAHSVIKHLKLATDVQLRQQKHGYNGPTGRWTARYVSLSKT